MKPTLELHPRDGTALGDSSTSLRAEALAAASTATKTPSLLVWQLADSALPTGGFAHSSGLEAARQAGLVRQRQHLDEWLRTSLRQLPYAALPFVNAVHAEPARLIEVDGICDAFTSNHVANRASRAQGRALRSLARRVFPEVRREPTEPEPAAGHYAPVFGWLTVRLGLDPDTTRELFVFQFLRGTLAAAVRLNLVGPMEAQAIQCDLQGVAEAAARTGAACTLDDLAQTAPILDILQGTQDRLYSRLFQS